MLFDNGYEALRRFELVRRLLGHTVVLNEKQLQLLRKLWEREAPIARVEAVVVHYAAILELNVQLDRQPGQPDPVLPDIDPRAGRIVHQTCTGNTVLEVNLNQGTLQMWRPGAAIDPSETLRAALAILTGYLAGWDREAVKWQDVIDPRIPARLVLQDLLGDEESERVLATYVPHWEAWMLEQEVAKAEAALRLLRERRRHLLQRKLDVRPQPATSGGQEPLQRWERGLLAEDNGCSQ